MSLIRLSRCSPLRRMTCTLEPLAADSSRIEQQVRKTQDRGHRRADFVAHVRQELALGPVRCLRRFLGDLQAL